MLISKPNKFFFLLNLLRNIWYVLSKGHQAYKQSKIKLIKILNIFIIMQNYDKAIWVH